MADQRPCRRPLAAATAVLSALPGAATAAPNQHSNERLKMCDNHRRLATALDYYLEHVLAPDDPERGAYQQLRDEQREIDSAAARLLREVEQAVLDELDLDELVYDCDQCASNVNNQGVKAQVTFIVEALGVRSAESELRKLISERPHAATPGRQG